MAFSRKIIYLILFLILLAGLIVFFFTKINEKPFFKSLVLFKVSPTSSIPQNIQVEGKTKVKYPEDYTIILVGDSMTEKLGNSDELRSYLHNYYPNKTFEVLNYGFGSTNILSVPDRLEKETFYTRSYRPMLDIDFDLILLESFGHNPLSTLSLEEGLKKQTETLDKIMAAIKSSNPKAKIVFMATISPNKKRYGEGQVDLTTDKRTEWANERIAYIKNHIEYAKFHNIPLVNVFEKSLNSDGDGNIDYISSADFIHPSPSGVYLISEEIAKTIYENKILSP